MKHWSPILLAVFACSCAPARRSLEGLDPVAASGVSIVVRDGNDWIYGHTTREEVQEDPDSKASVEDRFVLLGSGTFPDWKWSVVDRDFNSVVPGSWDAIRPFPPGGTATFAWRDAALYQLTTDGTVRQVDCAYANYLSSYLSGFSFEARGVTYWFWSGAWHVSTTGAGCDHGE